MLSTSGLDPEAREHCQSALTDLEEIYRNVFWFSSNEAVYVSRIT